MVWFNYGYEAGVIVGKGKPFKLTVWELSRYIFGKLLLHRLHFKTSIFGKLLFHRLVSFFVQNIFNQATSFNQAAFRWPPWSLQIFAAAWAGCIEPRGCKLPAAASWLAESILHREETAWLQLQRCSSKLFRARFSQENNKRHLNCWLFY